MARTKKEAVEQVEENTAELVNEDKEVEVEEVKSEAIDVEIVEVEETKEDSRDLFTKIKENKLVILLMTIAAIAFTYYVFNFIQSVISNDMKVFLFKEINVLSTQLNISFENIYRGIVFLLLLVATPLVLTVIGLWLFILSAVNKKFNKYVGLDFIEVACWINILFFILLAVASGIVAFTSLFSGESRAINVVAVAIAISALLGLYLIMSLNIVRKIKKSTKTGKYLKLSVFVGVCNVLVALSNISDIISNANANVFNSLLVVISYSIWGYLIFYYNYKIKEHKRSYNN